MSKKQKRSSCLGLFVKAFVVSTLVLANLCALGVVIAVKIFGADYATWTDFSHMTSHPWLLLYGVMVVAFLFSVGLAALGGVVELVFGRKKQAGSRPAAPRPTSNRRTTV